jgi:Polyketide cyclase / dehydrase and lipid transport
MAHNWPIDNVMVPDEPPGSAREDYAMGDSSYAFRSVWHVSASPDDVLHALERLADYPLWWPEIRDVLPLGDQTFQVTCKSTLAFKLCFAARPILRDRAARVLEARLTGDLEGSCRWTIGVHATGTSVTFDGDVTPQKTLLRRIGPLARPALKAYHSRMMRNGERGLRTYLAGYRASFD